MHRWGGHEWNDSTNVLIWEGRNFRYNPIERLRYAAMALNAEEIYLRYIKGLSVAERLRLLEITARELAATGQPNQPKRSLLELEGLGAEIWQGVDAQEYVNKLRREWDNRP